MTRELIGPAAVILAALLMGGVGYYLTRPTCYVCTWCGKLYKRDGSPATGEDELHVGHGLCQECLTTHHPFLEHQRGFLWFLGALTLLAAPITALLYLLF